VNVLYRPLAVVCMDSPDDATKWNNLFHYSAPPTPSSAPRWSLFAEQISYRVRDPDEHEGNGSKGQPRHSEQDFHPPRAFHDVAHNPPRVCPRRASWPGRVALAIACLGRPRLLSARCPGAGRPPGEPSLSQAGYGTHLDRDGDGVGCER
jgi:hypothetical protein